MSAISEMWHDSLFGGCDTAIFCFVLSCFVQILKIQMTQDVTGVKQSNIIFMYTLKP